jgi:hypothetical protein
VKGNFKSVLILLTAAVLACTAGCGGNNLGAVSYVRGSDGGEPISMKSILTDGRLPDYLRLAYYPPMQYEFAETYYVSSSSGDDANDGKTESTPFKTLAKLTEITFSPGTGIFLKAGDVFEESATFTGDGTADRPIVITSYGSGAKPLVRAPVHVLYFRNVSGYVIDSLAVQITTEHELLTTESGMETQRAIFFDYWGDPQGQYGDITVNNCDIFGTGIYKNTQGVVLLAAYTHHEYANITNVTITNNTFNDLGWLGFATIAWNSARSGALAYPGVYNNVVVENNYFANIGHTGGYTHGAQGGYFARNYAHDIGFFDDPAGAGWGNVGLMTIGTKNLDILFNEIHTMSDAGSGHDGVAIDIDWSSALIRVKYNYVYDCFGSGIATMAARDCYISNNRVKNNRARTYPSRGQITLTDYQGDRNPERMTGISNFGVNQNLIYVDVSGTSALGGNIYTPGKQWQLNRFTGNRVVMLNHTDTRMFNMMGNSVIDTFEDNFYFTNRNFRAALEFSGAGFSSFEQWQEAGHDQNGRLLPISTSQPADVKSASARVENGKIILEWERSTDKETGIWHYNIHLGNRDNQVPTYHNLMGETSALQFSFDAPTVPGTYIIMITAENNIGLISENAAVVEITV